MPSTLRLLALALCICAVRALDNGVARTPIMGWSSWDVYRYNVTTDNLSYQADLLVSTGLLKAGYQYLLIDDGWMACSKFRDDGGCEVPAPRDAQGRLYPDPAKFPNGFGPLITYATQLGIKMGIYTAVSATTCGGFPASLGHESVDAATFAEWGFQFVKHDTCNYDCGIHDGCIQKSTAAMSAALVATGKPIVYYIDDGNDSTDMRLYNPNKHLVDPTLYIKIGYQPSEWIYSWGPQVANMWKFWFDCADRWDSVLDNIHRMNNGIAAYQTCGAFNHPDMLMIGHKNQPFNHYRAQFFTFVTLGAGLILDANLADLTSNDIAMLTASEILQVDQDAECVQGSLVRAVAGAETYIRPLADDTFAVTLLNTTPNPLNITVNIDTDYNKGDFYPVELSAARVKDLYLQEDLGVFDTVFVAEVPAEDARIFRFTPASQ